MEGAEEEAEKGTAKEKKWRGWMNTVLKVIAKSDWESITLRVERKEFHATRADLVLERAASQDNNEAVEKKLATFLSGFMTMQECHDVFAKTRFSVEITVSGHWCFGSRLDLDLIE